MVWVLDLSWGRNLSFVSISRLGRHAQPPCTTCKSLRLNLYNCDSQVDCAFHLHLVLRLAQFVLIILGHIVLRLVLVYLCACVLVCLCACVFVYLCTCVPNLAKSTRLASWKALKKPSSGPMHEHWAPKEVSLGFNFEFCKCKWWALNQKKFFWAYLIHTHSIAMFSIIDYWAGPTVGVKLVRRDLNNFSDTIRVIFQNQTSAHKDNIWSLLLGSLESKHIWISF